MLAAKPREPQQALRKKERREEMTEVMAYPFLKLKF